MNYFNQNQQDEEEDFKDQPDEMTGESSPEPEVRVERPKRALPPPTQQAAQELADEVIEQMEADEEVEESQVLTDARLRLEMGKLYELIMKHDLFEGVDSDPKAMKTVQKEIRAYAQERMEIMLGMRQEQSKEQVNAFPMELFPFNSLEVEALKALAAAATKGASRDAEPLDLGPQKPPARTSLNPIGKGSGKTTPVKPQAAAKPLANQPAKPVARQISSKVQKILEEEGLTMEEINAVFDKRTEYLTAKELASMTEEQIIERNRKVKNARASNPSAMPMPSPEQIEAAVMARAQAAAANPQMQQIMGLLDKVQRKS